MVRKLFKHEFAAMGRLMLPVLCAVLGVGILTRLILFFESDTIGFNIIGGSSFLMLFVVMFVGVFLALVFGVIRYYKNLFSTEGYLSFTLPVTPAHHLMVKSVTAVTFYVAAALTALVSLVIALSGDPLVEGVKAASYIWAHLPEDLNKVHLVFYAIEFAVYMLISVFSSFFLYYTCITIGQMANKYRIMMAVGIYFVYYLIMQVFSTVMSVLFSVFAVTPLMEKVAQFIADNFYLCGHGFLIGSILIGLLIVGVEFLVCHTIIRKKLNLE